MQAPKMEEKMPLDKIALQYLADDLALASDALERAKQSQGQTAFEQVQKAHDLVNKVQRRILQTISKRR